MNKNTLINLLTGFTAKLVRYGLTAIGGIVGSDGLKNNDGTEIAVALVSILFPLLWSWLEDKARSNATAKALLEVVDGEDAKTAAGNTATLNKVKLPSQ
jgi:hypothetical protein